MASNLAVNYKFLFGFLTCNCPEDTIDVKLMVHTLLGIHAFKKNRNTEVIRCSPWEREVQPFLPLQRKMMEYLRQKQTFATPFVNMSYQSTPKRRPTHRPH